MEGLNMDRVNIDPKDVEQGFAKLVLIIIELLRRLVEKQAFRRIEGESLTDEEVEQLGVTLMQLENKMHEMVDLFGLDYDDLNINLGPLGNLM